MFSKIHPCCEETIIAAAIPAPIADVRRLKELRAYFRLESVTVLSTLRALKRTYSFWTHRCRALRWIFEYAFISELASAPGRFLVAIMNMRTYLSADGSSVFTDLRCNARETPAQGESSLDQQSVVISEVFHNKSFPAGYRGNCS